MKFLLQIKITVFKLSDCIFCYESKTNSEVTDISRNDAARDDGRGDSNAIYTWYG